MSTSNTNGLSEIEIKVPMQCQSESFIKTEPASESRDITETKSSEPVRCSEAPVEKVTIVEALHHKYSDDSLPEDVPIYISTAAPGRTDSGNLRVPPILSLNSLGVTHAGDTADLQDICSHVTEFDLAGNSLADWTQIFQVICCMPRLHFLNVSMNPLGAESFPELMEFQTAPPLEQLVLNKTRVSWRTVVKLLELFPRLQELHIGFNEYSRIELPESFSSSSLTSLLLNGNALMDATQLRLLGNAFPHLTNLVLIENRFTHLADAQSWCPAFPELRSFNLSNNQLSVLEEVEKLRQLPAMTDLRIGANPATPRHVEPVRRRIIAYLPRLCRLNGTNISATEREDSERDFIRHFDALEEKPQRYRELREIHGTVHPFAQVDMNKGQEVQLRVQYDGKEFPLTVKLKLTVRELRKLVSQLVGLPVSGMRMFQMTSDGHPTYLRYLTTPLHRLRLEDNDSILVDGE